MAVEWPLCTVRREAEEDWGKGRCRPDALPVMSGELQRRTIVPVLQRRSGSVECNAPTAMTYRKELAVGRHVLRYRSTSLFDRRPQDRRRGTCTES
jgi:hypothetical protein